MIRKFALTGFVTMISLGWSAAVHAADKVNLLLLPFLSQAPLFIAMEEGYFDDQNIEIVPAAFSSFSAVVPGIMNSEYDIAMMSTSPGFFNSIAKGAKGRIVAPAITLSKGDCEYLSFYGRKDADWSPLKTGQSVKYSVSTEPASVNQFLTDRIKTLPGAEGFSYDIRLSPPHTELPALKAKSVDMISTTEPWVTRADKAGIGHTVYGGSDLFEGLQYSYFMLSPRLVADDPDLGRRLMKAVSAGVAKYNEGKTERNVEIIAKHTKLPPELLMTACWADIPENAAIDAEKLDALQSWFLENGFISAKLPMDAVVHKFLP